MMEQILKRRIPVQEGLFTWPSDEPQLIASRCSACGDVAFPRQQSCPDCSSDDVDEILLSRRGTVWTWTIQNFPPPIPPYAGSGDRDTFVPYGVAYIELPEGIRVEARLTENDPEKLSIGMEMEMVVEKFASDDDGNELVTFAFQPV
ncbi:MAG: Zn-ribbon domain-containing OB-fold protein [Deltaproteobacteria bacterium]|nr:Zn-ribbon domain-containing OB-fold protein [Deltaproteobacteria bacterium]